jgi:NAD(P)-dependent dehydrogenase (short-subunit alcohol dehydrogenase family)
VREVTKKAMMEIKDSTFLVSGGGSGLGAATARALAHAGASLLIADVNEEAGEKVAAELGEKAKFVRTDVTDEQSVRDAVDAAVKAFGGLDGAVNCAGIGPAARVLGRKGPHPLDIFEETVQINLIGTFNVTRLAGARISEGGPGEDGERGVIVNTASVAAFDGQIGQAAYSASKGGIVAMTLPIAREFARFGIRVVTIAPGTFNTPMVEGLPEDARESLGQQVPFPSRLGEPSEFAALAKHIIENRMLNGEVIRLDGAIRMAPK